MFRPVKEKTMADDLIAKALIALERGDVGSATAHRTALGYVIVRDNRYHLAGSHKEIDDGINALINKAGSLG